MTIVTHYYGGVDPGLGGALAIVDQWGALAKLGDMPHVDKRVTAALLAPWTAIDVEMWGIELVQARPKEGRTSTFNFGASWGVVHGALGARHRPIIDVRPAEWKATFKIGGAQDKQKAKALRLAAQYWPEWADWFALAKHDGRAEAALIAKHVQITTQATQGATP